MTANSATGNGATHVSLTVPPVHPVIRLATAPILWGLAASIAFYAALPHLPIEREFVARYFAGHWIAYANTGMGFVGLAILCSKCWNLFAERAVFPAIPAPWTSPEADLPTRAADLERVVLSLPAQLRQTTLGRRLADLCEYLRTRTTAGGEGIESHWKYLGDLAAAQLHGSYALVRTLTWTIPVLGFLGTVLGITLAVARMTPAALDAPLGAVTAGLATALDTTAFALGVSMILVFATFVVERQETRLGEEVEQFGIRHLLPWFAAEETGPLVDAEAQAARRLLESTEALIGRQTGLWQESLEHLRRSWLEVARRQQDELSWTLREGMAATLSDHARQLADLRSQLVGAVQDTAEALQGVADKVAEASGEQQRRFAQLVGELWTNTSGRLEALPLALKEELAGASRDLAKSVGRWHADLGETTEALRSQSHELQRHGELLAGIVEDERQLVRLQDVLRQNLETVTSTDTFEKTLHSLSAAVHLLTVRTKHAA